MIFDAVPFILFDREGDGVPFILSDREGDGGNLQRKEHFGQKSFRINPTITFTGSQFLFDLKPLLVPI